MLLPLLLPLLFVVGVLLLLLPLLLFVELLFSVVLLLLFMCVGTGGVVGGVVGCCVVVVVVIVGAFCVWLCKQVIHFVLFQGFGENALQSQFTHFCIS